MFRKVMKIRFMFVDFKNKFFFFERRFILYDLGLILVVGFKVSNFFFVV